MACQNHETRYYEQHSDTREQALQTHREVVHPSSLLGIEFVEGFAEISKGDGRAGSPAKRFASSK